MISLLSIALAGEAQDWDAGYWAGQLDGAQVPTQEFIAYGAGAGCIQGAIGCGGLATAAYFIDPNAWDPLQGEPPDVNRPDSLPDVPAGIQHPDAWLAGYEEGWDQAVQESRARNALIGGAGPVALRSAAIGGYVVFILLVTGAML